MKIKLIYPPGFIRFNPIPPLGITTLTEILLKAGCDVDQEDLELAYWKYNQQSSKENRIELLPLIDVEHVSGIIEKNQLQNPNIARFLKNFTIGDYDLFGFSVMGTDQLASALLLAYHIKRISNAIITFGGCVPSGHADTILKNYQFVDYVFLGDACETFPKLVHRLSEKQPIAEIDGIAYRDNNTVKKSYSCSLCLEKMAAPNLKDMPMPDYITRLNFIYKTDFNQPILQYLVTDGCNNACAFCRRANSGGVQLKSPKKVTQEIRKLRDQYKSIYFKLETNEINPTEGYLLQLCDEFEKKRLNIFWHTYARLDNLQKSTLLRMKECGCIMLRFGVETGSQSLLNKVNKNYSIPEMERILRDSHDVGIWNAIYLISGLPGETAEDVESTLSFIERNHENINGAAINVFFLLKDTDIYLNPEKYGIRFNVNYKNSMCYDEYVTGLNWQDKKVVSVRSAKKIQEALIKYNIGLTAVSSDLMFTALIHNKNHQKTTDWLKENHPYLFEVLPPNIARWHIYHRNEPVPDNFEDWYYYKRNVGTVLS